MNNLIDNRQIRVFISSTFQDMQDERDYLMKRVFPTLRDLAAKRDVTLTELDLRWGITEEEAKSGKVVEICLREIENSIPFFIGIIGNRYGWVPEKKDIGEHVTDRFKDVNNYLERHLSVTEMEMQFGVLAREEDMHAFFYIKEGEDKENADNPEMLERLKKEVKASRYPSTTYASPEDLGTQVEQAFKALLDQLFPEGHLSELEKERIGQRSFMNQLCQNYIRDDKNFQVLDEWMNDWNQHQLVVTGASGLGKSALIANWLKEKLSDENRGCNIIYHFTGNGGSESSHEEITKTLIEEINDVYGWETGERNNKERKDVLDDLFIKVTSEGKKPMLIVLDAINQIVDTDNAKLLNWLPIPPKNIKILFSTLEDDRTMEVFNNRHYPVFVLHPLNQKRREELVINYLKQYGKSLKDEQVERIITDKQCENTLVLKTLLDELINFGVYEKLDERIDYYLSQDTIEGFYQALLQNYENDYDGYCENFVKHVLSIIVLSRNGLNEEEILKATGIKPLYWSQFYCAFSTHLVSKEGFISFAHRYVQNAVEERYTDDKEWVRGCRNEILSVVADTNTIRYLEEHTHQLDQLGEYSKLHDLLLDLETFSTYYKVHPYELGRYWRHLTTLGYSISEYLSIEDNSISNNNKAQYHIDLGYFSGEIMADYDNALLFHMKAHEIIEKSFGEDHPYAATSCNNIGVFYRYKGEYNKALDYHIKALRIRKKLLGKEHPETANSCNSIGMVYHTTGNYDMALKYYMKALEIWEKVFGMEHPDIATSYNNIGLVYNDKGAYDMALDYYMKALDILEKMLGKEHPKTAITYNNIGLIYDNKGDYIKALEYYLMASDVREKVLGKEHPETSDSYNNIGVVYHKEGDYDKALEYYSIALEIREKVLGMDHPSATASYDNIGMVYHDKGDYDKALDYHMKALEIKEKVLGLEHSDTANSYNNIGNIYEKKGDYDKALGYYLKALETREKVLGKEHPKTATSYNNIGLIYDNNGDYIKALEYYLKALEIREKILGKEHPETSDSYNNIGGVYDKEEDYDKALEYYTKALEIQEKVLGMEHPKIAISYNNIGLAYNNKGEYNKALEYYLKALEVKEKMLGKEHPSTATTYNNIGLVYYNKGDYGKALMYYGKALEIREKMLGIAHPNTATSYFSIGVAYNSKGKYNNALEYYMKALEIWEKVLGKEHPNTISSYGRIGYIYFILNNYDQALGWFSKAAERGHKFVYNELAWTYHLVGKYEKALPWAEKAVASFPNNAEIIDTLATIYQGLGRYDEALEQFELCLKLKKEQGANEDSIHETEEKIEELKKQLNKKL